ncbi:MAG TPA: TonB-dependent receptor plug domain-containing protein [Bacteroidales bacterium]|nr:TonB-dependent receptor plug domain-containing protein [Bacteroidales bacterium]
MRTVILNIIFLIVPISVFSQNITKDTIYLPEVIVTEKKIRKEDKSVVPLQTITRIELDRVSGTNLADAIKHFSGVVIKDYGGIGGLKTVMVRSLGANHTGVYMDGVQFSDVATGQVDLGRINTDNADEVSLIIGQSADYCLPARFYASASVVNINSIPPDFNKKNTKYKIGTKTGSFGLFSPFISVQNKIGENFYSDISINYAQANGEYPYLMKYGSKSDTTVYRKNSEIQSLNPYITISGTFKNGSKLSFKNYLYWSQRGLPGAVVYYNPFSAQRLWNTDYFTNLQYKTADTSRLQYLANIKFSQNYLRYLDPEYLNEERKLDNKYLQREYYFSMAMSFRLSGLLLLSMASDFFVNTLSANLYNYSNPIRHSNISVLALNYSRKNLEASSNLLATFVNEKTLSGEPAPSRKKLNPSFSLWYKIVQKPNVKVRVMYKDIFRMPTFNDLYYTLVGNNNLRPELTKQLNIGLISITAFLFFDNISFKTDIFYNRIHDKIVAIPTKNLFVWSMQNVGIVETKGIELQSQIETKKISEDFYISSTVNYTYQRASDLTQKGSATYGNQIAYIPFETISALSSLNYKKISLNYNIIYNGFRYVLGENIYENMIPSWWISDISLLYCFELKIININLKTELSNIFNKQHEVIRSFPMPGRAFYLTLILKK